MTRNTIRSIIAACSLGLLLGSGAIAQQQVEDIKGRNIQDQQGKQMGTIEEVLVGPDGKIQSVVVEKGGFLGFGGETNRIPWDALREGQEGNYIYIQGSEQAQAATQQEPGAGKQQQQAETQAMQDQQEVSQATGQQDTAQQDRQDTGLAAAGMEAAKADQLMGRTIVGKNGNELGTVQDKHLAQDGKTVEYLIIKASDDKMHPLPAGLVKPEEGKQKLMADIDQEMFQNSPSFSPEEQPKLGQQQWSRQIQDYYGVAPAWQEPGKQPRQQSEQQ